MYSNRDLLAKTLQAEAGNQGLGGMLAVGSVIANRMGSGQSWRDVILAPGQFSAWNKVTGYAGGEQGQDMAALEPSEDAYAAADAILSGDFVDVTGGATHYYNPDISQPNWGASAGGDWQRIGAHLFGKAGAFKTGASEMDGQQPTAQQMQQMQRRGGLMGFLQDPRTREVLTSFSRSSVGEKLADIARRDREAMRGRESDNKTAQWLSTQKGGQPFARAILEGAMTGSQAYEAWLKQTQRSGTKIGDRLVDPVTGEVIYEDAEAEGQLSKEDLDRLNQINDDLRTRVKPFEEVRDGFQRIQSFFNAPSGVSDYALAVAFAKILDPGSVAREGEVAAVSRAGGAIQSFLQETQNFFSGRGALPPEVRNNIMKLSAESYATQLENAKLALEDAKMIAKAAGIDEKFLYKVPMPPAPELDIPINPPTAEMPNGPIPQAALDADLTQEDWNVMNDEERAPFEG